MSTVPRLECATVVAYFSAVPAHLARLLTDARVLASAAVGPLTVRTQVAYGARTEAEREHVREVGASRAWDGLESLARPNEWNVTDAERMSSYWSYDEPADRERHSGTFKAIDFTWRLRFEDWCAMSGVRTGPYMAMDFVLDRMRGRVGDLTEVVTQFSDHVASCSEFCSGCCDIADYHEISLGDYYSGKRIRWIIPQRAIALQRWLDVGSERVNMARGVFWANLFGPKMVEKLGGAEQFEREYSKFDRGMSRGIVHPLPSGSLLVYISEYCNRFMYPYSYEYEERAAWLYRRLAEVGLMC